MQNFFLHLDKLTKLGLIVFLFFNPATIVIAQTTDGVNVNISVTESGSGPSRGCKDPDAKNYDPDAGLNDQTLCIYWVPGCTDPVADNYDPAADQDNGSCFILPNVSDFAASYSQDDEQIRLSWKNPDYPGLVGVKIIRQIGRLPANSDDGLVVYIGAAEDLVDANIEFDSTYFYMIFAEYEGGRYSSGALAFTVVPGVTGNDDDNGEDGDDGDSDEDGGDGSGPADPFADFPQVASSDPRIIALSLGDFLVTQVGEPVQYFDQGRTVYIKAEKATTISLSYAKVPEVLKTIGVTMFDPTDPNKSFSFLLRLNQQQTFYTASIGPLNQPGTYRTKVYVLNFSDQTLKNIEGHLIALATGVPITAGTTRDITKGLAITTGLLALGVQTVAITTSLTSLADIYYLLLKLIGAILGFFGLKKRYQPWGTVYDAVTKRPIDPAYVSVMKVQAPDEEVATAITDIDGRYGFFLPAGTYILKAGKTHYRFPSQTLAGRSGDELYGNLYFGEPLAIEDQEVINKNIPLDPIGFDWNEFAKSKTEYFRLYSRREAWNQRLFLFLSGLGFLVSLVSLGLSPSWFGVLIVLLYLALFGFKKYWASSHRPIRLIKKESGEPVSFAVVRFFLFGLNTEVRSVVADSLGRFFTLLRPDTYYYTVDEKLSDGSYQQIYKSEPAWLKRGVLSGKIEV